MSARFRDRVCASRQTYPQSVNDGTRHISLAVNGEVLAVPDRGQTLLSALRTDLRLMGAKDGCSPQGQCGCCTVLVDGQPRVACVTPLRRVRDRQITTIEGLGDDEANAWSNALLRTGGSQCGFCTPGIVLRLVGLEAKLARPPLKGEVEQSLLAHLCRCTGWQTIVEAAVTIGESPTSSASTRDLTAATARATLEAGTPQRVAPDVALGAGGFSADTAPEGCLVAVPTPAGEWEVGENLDEARAAAGKVQGRRTTVAVSWPLELPVGDWVRTLRTTWVEPAYLETDAAWCEPGGESSSPIANAGAFGAKLDSPVSAAAQRLANEHGQAVLALAGREDATRWGPKRPPMAAGIRADGTGIVRVAATPGIADAIRSVAPDLVVEEVAVDGPNTSSDIRGAGWLETTVLVAGLRGEVGWIEAPNGGHATAEVTAEGIVVRVRCGEVLDETVLRSYCIGAAHMAWSLVHHESLAVVGGEINDLTIRSFDVARANETPAISVIIEEDGREAVNGSDAVFAAVASAAWIDAGCSQDWPISANMAT